MASRERRIDGGSLWCRSLLWEILFAKSRLEEEFESILLYLDAVLIYATGCMSRRHAARAWIVSCLQYLSEYYNRWGGIPWVIILPLPGLPLEYGNFAQSLSYCNEVHCPLSMVLMVQVVLLKEA